MNIFSNSYPAVEIHCPQQFILAPTSDFDARDFLEDYLNSLEQVALLKIQAIASGFLLRELKAMEQQFTKYRLPVRTQADHLFQFRLSMNELAGNVRQ